MALELEHSDLEDPFADSSIFSLLPRTLGTTPCVESTDAPKTYELDSFRALIKSKVGKGSNEVLDQAQVIHKTSSSILSLYSEDGHKAIVENGNDQPQVRRPALGRKRAQFSLKSNSSASLPSIDVNSSIDHIEDPEEYFLAFEKLENAGKELKKLRGDVSNDLLPNHSSPATRNRRPGILGKTASYKHHFPSQNDAVAALPQEEISDRTLSSPPKTSVDTIPGNVLQPREIEEPGPVVDREAISDSIAEEEKIGHILDELLSSFKDVHGNEEVAFLQEKLKIKTIDVEKIRLPEMTSFKRKDPEIVKNIARKAEGSLRPMSSPILLSSPLAAISLLQRRIPLKSPVRDPFSMYPSDNIQYAGGSSIIRGQGQSHSPVGIDHSDIGGSISDIASTPVRSSGERQKDDDKLPALGGETGIGKKTASEGPLTENTRLVLERATACPPNGSNNSNVVMPTELDSCLQDEVNNVIVDAAPCEQPEPVQEELTSEPLSNNGTDCLVGQSGLGFGESVDASPVRHDYAYQGEVNDTAGVAPVSNTPEHPEENSSGTQATIVPPDEHAEVSHTIPEGTSEEQDLPPSSGTSNRGAKRKAPSQKQKKPNHSSRRYSLAENSSGTQATIVPPDEHAEVSHTIPEGTSEEQDLAPNSGTSNRGAKHKAPSQKQKKPNPSSRRYSLAGAGTTWNAGVRRSTRIKSRPLQYWCGERFLYGRVHDSLATVIGVKYASPSNPKLKVKSFVSDEYADLVAQAALH
ncbi:hypothetical protein J5N97_019233 [Dioscorea zingiberensis]|uniref:Centromere protein C n=1 Tax=Dioscorea zingiberensis TaxID=325984 RepID=A0A9D5CE86_9LILI|nr:hypothetical protein J5N97_019233 [Dioscorea zingiberensis]